MILYVAVPNLRNESILLLLTRCTRQPCSLSMCEFSVQPRGLQVGVGVGRLESHVRGGCLRGQEVAVRVQVLFVVVHVDVLHF